MASHCSWERPRIHEGIFYVCIQKLSPWLALPFEKRVIILTGPTLQQYHAYLVQFVQT